LPSVGPAGSRYLKRTTVFLPDELHQRLRREALARHVSMAALIPARLKKSGAYPRAKGKDPLARVEGIVHDGTLTGGGALMERFTPPTAA
jgi:hypothetical protein